MSFIDNLYKEQPAIDNSAEIDLFQPIRNMIMDVCRKNKDLRHASGYYFCSTGEWTDSYALVDDFNKAHSFTDSQLKHYNITRAEFQMRVSKIIQELGITNADIRLVDQSSSDYLLHNIGVFLKRQKAGGFRNEYQKEKNFKLYVSIQW